MQFDSMRWCEVECVEVPFDEVKVRVVSSLGKVRCQFLGPKDWLCSRARFLR